MHFVLNIQMQEVIVSDAVYSGDEKLGESDILRKNERRNSDGPIYICHFINVVEILKEINFLSQFSVNACWLKGIVRIKLEYLRYLTICCY